MANLQSNGALILPGDASIPCPNCGRTTPSSEDPLPIPPTFASDPEELIYLREKVKEIPDLRDQIKGLLFFKDQVEELQLLKDQVQDVARVCNAVARGDLSQKITVVVQGVVMVQLKDVINTMVDKLGQFAKEVTRVSQEVGTEG
jgi:methyl-accepting chemotaxis protein